MKRPINAEPIVFIVGFVFGVYYMVLSPFLFRKQCLLMFGNAINDAEKLAAYCRQMHIEKNNSQSAANAEDVQIEVNKKF
jgi:hypothetical protein